MKKPWYQSKAVIGIILTIVQAILKQHNIEVPLLGAETGELLTGGLAAYGMRDAMGGGLGKKPA